MATFPALEPETRSYDLGVFPLTDQRSASAGSVRFAHSGSASGFGLQLEFTYLSQAEAALIRSHFQNQVGSYLAFDLPAIVWQGHTSTTQVFPAGTTWRYAAPIEEEHLSGGLVNVSVSLVSFGT